MAISEMTPIFLPKEGRKVDCNYCCTIGARGFLFVTQLPRLLEVKQSLIICWFKTLRSREIFFVFARESEMALYDAGCCCVVTMK